MRWNLGYSAAYYLTVVDPGTWRDQDRIEITAGRISRTNSGLRCSADFDCKDYTHDRELWVRCYMVASQGSDAERVPLFTGIVAPPDRNLEGGVETNQLLCNSVLQPAEDVYLPLGWYAPTSTSAGLIIKDLLSVCPAPVKVIGTAPKLSDYIIAEQNETRLTMVEKILEAIGWRLRIEGDGTITICAPATDPVKVFDAISYDTIEPHVSVSNSAYKSPNVFRAISGTSVYIARDDDPDSPLSTVSRGREIWAEESAADLNDNEGIDVYAKRRLKELQQHYITINYNRRYEPDIVPSDKIELRYPGKRINGVYEITTQTITLGAGCKTSEEVISA